VKTSVVFVHGFTGDSGTWGNFPQLLQQDSTLKDYEFHFWEYGSTLNLSYIVTKYFWTDDAPIDVIGQSLRTFLQANADDADRLMLVAHSMGGLVAQAFVLEEIAKQSGKYLDRLTEIVLCGTPSAGLPAGLFGSPLKNQIADMNAYGVFIQKLRAAWSLEVDGKRSDPKRPAKFRLTPIAGERDKFVPLPTSIGPFKLDENFIVPGDHVSMVKPVSHSDVVYRIIRQRLESDTPTGTQLNFVAETQLKFMSRIAAAREFGETSMLLELAKELAEAPVDLPLVRRELGLALVGAEQYAPAVETLEAYLDSPAHKARPAVDVEAIQQLAVALSGEGKNAEAVARLKMLPPEYLSDPETQGIMAGRYKRHWLKVASPQLGRRALDTYHTAYQTAKARGDDQQIIYNGINTAYMDFALDGTAYQAIAAGVLATCKNMQNPDYWTLASIAEAHLLLDEVPQAKQAYKFALQRAEEVRHVTTTATQAIDIARRKNVMDPELMALLSSQAS
jgi:tetratricopeptide (TPR) repeat protein